ncbi:hypothetical protein HGRIS_007918 [Hohenbuehelia grisea]|uniref:Uncharacterized protein n=1 Tax=Hohenbuehelia grisea TaxID=104357 RepID=A0ABR3J7Q3_9AGAR
MVSLMPSTSLTPLEVAQPRLNEVGNLREAIEPLKELVLRSHNSSIHLHCTVPTWCHSSSTCFDLHDLHERRSNFLVFIHDVLQSLRASGVSLSLLCLVGPSSKRPLQINASYSLTPSDSSLCLACALPPNLGPSEARTAVVDLLQSSNLSANSHVLLADMKHGPCLIVS